jgi:hypothetical protein
MCVCVCVYELFDKASPFMPPYALNIHRPSKLSRWVGLLAQLKNLKVQKVCEHKIMPAHIIIIIITCCSCHLHMYVTFLHVCVCLNLEKTKLCIDSPPPLLFTITRCYYLVSNWGRGIGTAQHSMRACQYRYQYKYLNKTKETRN